MKVKEKEHIYDKYMATHFRALHEKEEGEFEPYYKYFKKNYSKHLPASKESQILDVGCGMGHFLYFLRKEGYKNWLGIDISKENIEFCKKDGFNVKLSNAFDFFAGNAEHFDVIVMNDIIEHFNKQEIVEILRFIYERLNKNGKVIIKVPNAANPILASASRYMDFTHELIFTEESLSQILGVCGYEEVQIYPSDIYVFYNNPLNYISKLFSTILNVIFRLLFMLHGRKTTKIFTKHIIAVATVE